MTPEGYKLIENALRSSQDIGEFNITPEPVVGQNVAMLAITASAEASTITAALDEAGLFRDDKDTSPRSATPVSETPFLRWRNNSHLKDGRTLIEFDDTSAPLDINKQNAN
jgi:hypothetical protein